MLNALFDSILSIKEIIYVFFNTRLRNEITVDHLMDYAMQKRGISAENFISLLSGYWFYGKVRYITEDGSVSYTHLLADIFGHGQTLRSTTGGGVDDTVDDVFHKFPPDD